tara:strand:+ start:856 stop:1332 length:477 start_codon:yes stop_codon:yes gene_type:complete
MLLLVGGDYHVYPKYDFLELFSRSIENKNTSAPSMLQQIGLVALGGSIGASLRYAIGSWITYDSFPIATISVNVIGSFILGIIALSVSQSLISTELALFLGVGIIGSFTTMSAFSVETIEMLQDGNTSSAGIYIILTFTLCPVLAWLGWIIGDKLLIS